VLEAKEAQLASAPYLVGKSMRMWENHDLDDDKKEFFRFAP